VGITWRKTTHPVLENVKAKMGGDKVNVAHTIDGCADPTKIPNIIVESFAQVCSPYSFECFIGLKIIVWHRLSCLVSTDVLPLRVQFR